MQTCRVCGNQFLDGVIFCEYCGEPFGDLSKFGFMSTRRLQTTEQQPQPPTDTLPQSWGGTTTLQASQSLVFHVNDGAPIRLPIENEILMGRADPSAGRQPELDLTPFDGGRLGVSRRHAFLKRQEDGLVLVDLKSTNGTWLNTTKLQPSMPHLVRDGDQIRLGRLKIKVFFA